jgi:hypothetical protein
MFSIVLLAALAGCTSRQFTTTPRAAVEQLLLSAAVDAAMERLELPEVAGKNVYLDFSNLQAYDVEYIRVAARARFAELGATLVGGPEQADLVAELASGGFGLEYKKGVVGLPSLPVPNSPIPSPELAAYKSVEQTAILKLLVFLRAGGRFIAARHYYAKAERDESFVLFWRHQRRDDVRRRWQRAELKVKPERVD